MKGLLGTKLGMTQYIDEDGVATPVTIILAGPCYVTQVKTEKTDGYNAIQVGFEEVKERRLTRGELGHLGLLETDEKHPNRRNVDGLKPLRYLREFRVDNPEAYEEGQVLSVDVFEAGEKIDVAGRTKGRGFAGTVKRHGFAGGPKTHGQSDRHRAPGSIGATSTNARVFKGTRMAGRMGNQLLTVQNLEVMRIDLERNLIAIKGGVPGAKGGFVVLKEAAKA